MVRFSPEMCSPVSLPAGKRLRSTETTSDDLLKFLIPDEQGLTGSISSPPVVQQTSRWLDDDDRVTATSFDLDALECVVCMEPLSAPIFQCCNGHYACHDCTAKMNNKCPTCSEPTGRIRNLGLERIIDSLRLRCNFSANGCMKVLSHGMKKVHEQKCLFAVVGCPASDCDFSGPIRDFSLHFLESHDFRTIQFQYDKWFTVSLRIGDMYMLLQSEDTLFLLHNSQEELGNVVYVTSFHPLMQEQSYTYCMEVKNGKRRLTMESVVQNHRNFKYEPYPYDFLVIPNKTFASQGCLEIEFSFHQPGESVQASYSDRL